jgi:hypothetical protein
MLINRNKRQSMIVGAIILALPVLVCATGTAPTDITGIVAKVKGSFS